MSILFLFDVFVVFIRKTVESMSLVLLTVVDALVNEILYHISIHTHHADENGMISIHMFS